MLLCESEKTGNYNRDIYSQDSVLDGLDFDTLILEMKCNYPKEKITSENVIKQFKEDLEIRLQDSYILLEYAMENIIKAAKGEIE